ncbi:MAG: M81 family metallopeptidase [Acidobacteria bacterium]|nr:M81 family metallopeptidase [Acidobacteriota bacterium]
MKRVVVAGLFHETHSFLDGHTDLDNFEIREGEALLEAIGDPSPLGGVLEVGRAEGWKIIPSVDMRAMPGPVVTDAVVELFWSKVKSTIELCGAENIDGIFIVLHGAMVSQSLDDVEGELLSRIRELFAIKQPPVSIVLDLHANLTSQMVRHADVMVAYRENPHVDAKAAAIDAARFLARLMRTQEKTETIFVHPPVMWPPTGTATADEPMKSLEMLAREIEQANPDILVVNVFAGFAFADTPGTGVSFALTALKPADAARGELKRLADLAVEKRDIGNAANLSLDSVLAKLSEHSQGPIVLVEPSDNIGAGAPGSGISLLQKLLECSIQNAAVVVHDPEAVILLSAKSIGEVMTITFGGKGSSAYSGPITLDAELMSISDGNFELEDSQSHLASMFGGHIQMGPCAVVRHQGIQILLTSRKTPPFDLGQWRSQGINPEELFVIGVKAAVAHRRAYDAIAKASYTVDTPGPCANNLRMLPYKKIQRPIYPLD